MCRQRFFVSADRSGRQRDRNFLFAVSADLSGRNFLFAVSADLSSRNFLFVVSADLSGRFLFANSSRRSPRPCLLRRSFRALFLVALQDLDIAEGKRLTQKEQLEHKIEVFYFY